MATKISYGGNATIERVINSKSVDDTRDAYDAWAEQYDGELADQDYVAPNTAAQETVSAGANITGEILDVGCGTGLCGVALAGAGAKAIDGLDLSPGMLTVAAKTGAYRKLSTADLSKPIPDVKDESYDVVTCVGTLTHGHVKPVPALAEFVRVVKKNGFVVATILEDVWDSGGYAAEVKRLGEQGFVEVVSTKSKSYRKGADAIFLVLKKL